MFLGPPLNRELLHCSRPFWLHWASSPGAWCCQRKGKPGCCSSPGYHCTHSMASACLWALLFKQSACCLGRFLCQWHPTLLISNLHWTQEAFKSLSLFLLYPSPCSWGWGCSQQGPLAFISSAHGAELVSSLSIFPLDIYPDTLNCFC